MEAFLSATCRPTVGDCEKRSGAIGKTSDKSGPNNLDQRRPKNTDSRPFVKRPEVPLEGGPLGVNRFIGGSISVLAADHLG